MLKVLKEICYCGHPLKSHIGGQKKEDAGFWAEECYHCVCKRYIQDEQYTKQEEETEYLKTFPITFNGKQYSFENGKLFADGEEVYSTQKEPSSTPIVEECTPGNCPFSVIPDTPTSWGMSPEGWAAAKERHNKYHQ